MSSSNRKHSSRYIAETKALTIYRIGLIGDTTFSTQYLNSYYNNQSVQCIQTRRKKRQCLFKPKATKTTSTTKKNKNDKPKEFVAVVCNERTTQSTDFCSNVTKLRWRDCTYENPGRKLNLFNITYSKYIFLFFIIIIIPCKVNKKSNNNAIAWSNGEPIP